MEEQQVLELIDYTRYFEDIITLNTEIKDLISFTNLLLLFLAGCMIGIAVIFLLKGFD